MNFCFYERHVILLISALVITAEFGSGSGKEGSETSGALGQGFFIHKMDLLTAELHAVGARVFDTLPAECTETDDVGVTQRDDTFYTNTESLYKSISTNTKISANLEGAYTLGASVEAVTNNIASENTEVSGTSLNLKQTSKDRSLKKDCINSQPLDEVLLKDLDGLEREIKEPWQTRSWEKFKVFLEKHGSHVVKQVSSGASIHQYVFAKSSEHYNHRDFTVKACLSLGGATEAGKVGVSACSGITKEEEQKSSSFSMVKNLVVRGGTPKTRADLIDNINAASIKKFLVEGTTNPSPITYTFVPIWTILQTR
jgi:hypothetical protein